MKKNRRILLALMGLDIGGAETHVVELAKYLAKNGYTVYTVSSGGVYEKDLAMCGITNIYAPLTSKNPLAMLKAYHIIKKAVKKYRIDIIHGHARIPAFVCSLVHKTTKVPFLTTVHGIYSTEFPLKLLTNWGQETICVSEDIKNQVKDEYNIPEERLHLTINGINKDTFSSDTDYSDLYKEFGITDEDYKLVYVSRLDQGNSHGAFTLLESAEKLLSLIPKLKIIMVGSGSEYDNIATKACDFNKECGRNVFIMAGARTDVNKFTAMADVFLGISRAALEAMASGNIVILGGFGGYIGIFEKSKLDLCFDTNFTCRGCDEMTSENLISDVLKVYSMTEGERNDTINFGKSIVNEHYSIEAMAKSNIKTYDKLLARSPKISYDFMISGYYGFNNSGDDTLLMAMIETLKSNDNTLNIAVLSDNPRETSAKYNVCAIKRVNFFKIRSYMKNTKVFISGGGSLIQDVTSTKSIVYYLSLMKLAKWMNLPVMVYANGIGPITKQKNIRKSVSALNEADVITLREAESGELLREIGVDNKNIFITADPTFTLECADSKETDAIFAEYNIPEDKPIISISLRSWKKAPKDFEHTIANKLDELCCKYKVFPVFIPMQFPQDLNFSTKIASLMNTDSVIISKQHDGRILKGIIKRTDLTLAMRLHTLIYSAGVGVPVIGLSYDPKVKSFLEYTNTPYYIDVENTDISAIDDIFDHCYNNREEIRDNLTERLNQLKLLAEKNACMAIELLNKGEN